MIRTILELEHHDNNSMEKNRYMTDISIKSDLSAEDQYQIVLESFTDNVTQAEICPRHGIYPVQLIK